MRVCCVRFACVSGHVCIHGDMYLVGVVQGGLVNGKRKAQDSDESSSEEEDSEEEALPAKKSRKRGES